MGIENLDEYKKRKASRIKREAKYLNRNNEWLTAVYNPKNFRRIAKALAPKDNKSDFEKFLIYIFVVGFLFFLIITYAILK